ncbi:hypothetical protein Godav_004240 [Gossypium davidsonii]|uniref:Reverse transcriptase zinc-binding domain-containing protein n=1 Tax=Gossypium davidsonii TaxID=34287 RepID=A0A7J8SLV1_GOSDV|nr:hypothetical protein [Gossypium davidsonii]
MEWNKELVINTFSDVDVARILRISLEKEFHDDLVVWRGEPFGDFSILSAYKLLLPSILGPNFNDLHTTSRDFYRQLWNLQLPTKLKITVLRISRNFIPILVNLNHKQLVANMACPKCEGAKENLDHVLREYPVSIESLVANEDFQHILRVLNTNVDGKQKIMFALTSIKGIGRRFANIVCKKADVDMNKRAGELTAQELDNLMTIVANPRQFKIPDWFLNRQKDYKDGKYSQVVSNALDMKLRDDLERLKKIRNHRGLRHYWGLRVRGQHTKTTGRRGKTVGVSKKR